MVSTPLKHISQNGNLPQIGVKIKNIWVATTQKNMRICLKPMGGWSNRTWTKVQYSKVETHWIAQWWRPRPCAKTRRWRDRPGEKTEARKMKLYMICMSYRTSKKTTWDLVVVELFQQQHLRKELILISWIFCWGLFNESVLKTKRSYIFLLPTTTRQTHLKAENAGAVLVTDGSNGLWGATGIAHIAIVAWTEFGH